ncbi:MAG: ribonuclease HII [Pseudomonadota bacterium]
MPLLTSPDYSLEQALFDTGHRSICGVDEVGRGPMAGPVTAAAVILDPDNIPNGLNDSKKLLPVQREAAFEAIIATAHVSITSLSAKTIDDMNIRAASLHAMALCVSALEVIPDHALVDGNVLPQHMPCPATSVVKGDGRSLSIAAASIVAKVMRDRMMVVAEAHFPGYGLASHKGYPTLAHKAALATYGVTPLHRRSFKPVQQVLVKS